jgi:hypothetical protein
VGADRWVGHTKTIRPCPVSRRVSACCEHVAV